MSQEGFISFQHDAGALDTITFPIYSSTRKVYKLYDNVFFDNQNGNLIEVDGKAAIENTDEQGNMEVDQIGSSINKIHVVPRIGNSFKTYEITAPNSQLALGDVSNDMRNSFGAKVYETQGSNTDKYTIFYIGWLDNTYFHIIKNNDLKNISTFSFTNNTTGQNFSYDETSLFPSFDGEVTEGTWNDTTNVKRRVKNASNFLKYLPAGKESVEKCKEVVLADNTEMYGMFYKGTDEKKCALVKQGAEF